MKACRQVFAPLALVSLSLASIVPVHAQERLLGADVGLKKHHLVHDLVAFHRNLTEIESISGNEKHVGDWLASSLKAQGYNVEKQYISKDPERFNVFAWPGDNRDAPVVVTSHIDTVSTCR